jgi:hypothetical protein
MKHFFLVLSFLAGLIACQNTETDTSTTNESELQETGGFMRVEGRDTTVAELTFDGAKVTGYYAWQPYQKDGARGIIEGQKESDNLYHITFTYMIEGNVQSDKLLYQIVDGNLFESNPLPDGPINYEALVWSDGMAAVAVSDVQSILTFAKELAPELKKNSQ